MSIWGGVETGGTKCVCILANSPKEIAAETEFLTESPEETVKQIVQFFRAYDRKQKISGIGVASFGPIDLHSSSNTYGQITTTPKPGWSNFNLIASLKAELDLPICFDTDTNGAALGEYVWGNAKNLDNFIYLTIGTGIGGGGMLNGELMHGLVHPEMGHIKIPHNFGEDPFKGICPFHADCLEGLASGPAIEKRWGISAKNLPAEHPAWDLEAKYLASGLHNLICALSPQKVILGGGVMNQPGLIEKVREKVQESLAGYIQADPVIKEMDYYIVRPRLGDKAGVLGAVALAKFSHPTTLRIRK